jgi:hypothetical protein
MQPGMEALDEPGTLAQVQTMQAHVRAREVYFWGQEIVLAPLWKLLPEADPRQQARDLTDLPILWPTDLDYPAMLRAVMANRQRAAGGEGQPSPT